MFVIEKEGGPIVETGRYLCGLCGSGVGVNSILCVECNKWVHMRYSYLPKVAQAITFMCSACQWRGDLPNTTMNSNTIGTDEVITEVECSHSASGNVNL